MSGERTRKALRERVLQVVQNTLDEHDADESLSIDEELTDAILAVLDADPDTPTACETCGDAGWFTADPSDPEFCECAAGKRLMAANNADPDTATADAPADTARGETRQP